MLCFTLYILLTFLSIKSDLDQRLELFRAAEYNHAEYGCFLTTVGPRNLFPKLTAVSMVIYIFNNFSGCFKFIISS